MGSLDASLEVTRTVAPVRQQVVENLRRAIVEGRFRSAERLVERELCALTGASRSSVREALRQLESEGLIVTLPNRGPVVRTLGQAEIIDLYQVRALLEGLAGRLFVARANDGEVTELAASLDELERAFSAGDNRAALRAKDRFYEILLRGARSEVTQSLLRSLHNRISLVRSTTLVQPGRALGTIREMSAIVAAIRRRDADAAAAACTEHVQQAGTVALRVLDDRGGVEPALAAAPNA
jgi:DNA-binding GntR family transcriptional regulator